MPLFSFQFNFQLASVHAIPVFYLGEVRSSSPLLNLFICSTQKVCITVLKMLKQMADGALYF
ncbi:hypothetical protein BLX91_13740 [Bacillus subtilis]|nr:hypothetical protein BLX91_13740 [Bacillus subtilis]